MDDNNQGRTMTSSSHQEQVVVVVDFGRFNVGHGGNFAASLCPKNREVACEAVALLDCFGSEGEIANRLNQVEVESRWAPVLEHPNGQNHSNEGSHPIC